MSGVSHMVLLAGGIELYRYIRLYCVTPNHTRYVAIKSWQFSADGGTTKLPSAMTAASAPSPLVASASSEYSSTYAAWKAFDSDLTGTDWDTDINQTVPCWLLIDLGSGNGVSSINWTRMNASDYTGGNHIKDGRIEGSKTGAFAGEEVTLRSWTGNTDLDKTYTW